MGLISGFLKVITRRSLNEKLTASDFVYYKIVNFNEKVNKYLLQCINTKATFLIGINDIILDVDILYGLHPVQACYIGIEYAIGIKQNQKPAVFMDKEVISYSICRYGTYNLLYQDRSMNLCFVDIESKETFTMDPRDMALSEHAIAKFDAIQAFYVGLIAGLKMSKPSGIYRQINKYNRPQLKLIKK